ncbi:MAG TPA: 3-phosphoshikimate 1-carboxyvinyltransferase [Myxococcales bacterium]|nr:3-phosphoshikimate 1-carboxyvinyltransferase [Myxococcales bacterium]HIN86217.1 3-phosphoshikimate 1-carboxyvinyltransferase [Myxococcales bacterium]
MNRTVAVSPKTHAGGSVYPPGDKSISHRALMFNAMAHGTSIITNLGPGQDIQSSASILRALGVEISTDSTGACIVTGCGVEALTAPKAPLDCGNSGTTMRLMMGLLAGRPWPSMLFGDHSLNKRPMGRITTPLARMGASFELSQDERPPVTINGGKLHGMQYSTPIPSAQIKSAIMLAALQATGETQITEEFQSRDHSERMLAHMDAPISVSGNTITLRSGSLIAPEFLHVPGDLSSGAFFLALGALMKGPGIDLHDVGLNPSRTGILEVLENMGVKLVIHDTPHPFEPMGSVTAHHSQIRPIELNGELLLRAIDEIPIIAVLATQAQGRTIISDAGELRVKESDRLATTADFLNAMGARVEERPDGLIIDGPTELHAAQVDPHGDHRIAMAAAIAGTIAKEGELTLVHQADCADVSYPGFFDVLSNLTSNLIEVQ